MTLDGSDAPRLDDLLAMLHGDGQGWALARSVRVGGEVVDFELVYLNEAGARILGRAPGELIGRRYRELWPETVHDGTVPFYRQIVETRQPATRTVYYDRASVTGHFEMRIGPFGDGFVAQFIDLTQLTVGPRSTGGTRLYDVLDAAFDGFTLLRAVRDDSAEIVDFTCEFINQVGAKLAGRTVEGVIGRRLSEVPPASVGSPLFDRYREVAETGHPWREQIGYPEAGQVWEIKLARADVDFVAVSYRDITEQIGQQRQITQSTARSRRAAERTVMLQTVTAALVAASTSAQVYAAISSVVRPSVGGHGVALLLREDDQLVLRHHAGYERDVVDQLRNLPLTHQYPAAQVVTTGQSRYLCSRAEFAAAQPDPAHAISGGGRQAWAFLPLATAGDVLGVLVMGYTEEREFDDEEQAELRTLGGLCAQALQRAQLFEAQVSIAAALQRALLPAELPTVDGLRHAVAYLPWTHGTDVGGDWYDVISTGPDAVAVVIGDVVGHSAAAAATMGQVRNALGAYAAEGHSPTGVMERVNQLLLRMAPEAVATCCYLELHLAEGTATAVLAGHPPPVLRANGLVDTLGVRVGPPLGADHRTTYLDSSFLLPTGSDLILYTDGLVEDRRYRLDRGVADLCAAVRSAPSGDPQALLDHILSAKVGPRPRSDDVAILSLTVDGRPTSGPRTAQRRFRSDAVSASAARRFAADILNAWGLHSLVDDACLLLDEIITNAVQHTVGDVRVLMTLDERLRVEVHDRSDRQPSSRPVPADSETGRGLLIVDRVAAAWGTRPLPAGGKAVWFELHIGR